MMESYIGIRNRIIEDRLNGRVATRKARQRFIDHRLVSMAARLIRYPEKKHVVRQLGDPVGNIKWLRQCCLTWENTECDGYIGSFSVPFKILVPGEANSEYEDVDLLNPFLLALSRLNLKLSYTQYGYNELAVAVSVI